MIPTPSATWRAATGFSGDASDMSSLFGVASDIALSRRFSAGASSFTGLNRFQIDWPPTGVGRWGYKLGLWLSDSART